MSGHTVILKGNRETAHRIVDCAPMGSVLKVSPPKRTNDQNDKMWAMLTDISVQQMLGRKYTPDQWKAVMMSACGWSVQFLDGLDGTPFPAGFRSSKMTKAQMIDLITYIQAVGDENGIRWTDPALVGETA